MTVQAGTILSRARRILRDPSSTGRWSDTVLLDYLTDGREELIKLRPDTSPARVSLQLTESVSLHDILPDEAMVLLDVTRNMGTDGTTVGRAITRESIGKMDSLDRNWHNSSVVPEIDHWLMDERDPRKFFTYPRPRAGSYVEVLYSRLPPAFTATTDNIIVPDLWRNTLQLFVQAYPLLEDDPQADMPRGQTWLALAYQSIQVEGGIEVVSREDVGEQP